LVTIYVYVHTIVLYKWLGFGARLLLLKNVLLLEWVAVFFLFQHQGMQIKESTAVD
jgi:hypothetical protein